MTKISKKILALVMAMAMVITMLPLNAITAFAKNSEPGSSTFLTNGIDSGFTNTGNVTWDTTEQAAKFTGSNYLTLSGFDGFANVSASTGFAVSFDFKKSGSDNDFQWVFTLSNGSDNNNRFCFNAGPCAGNNTWRSGITIGAVNNAYNWYYANDLGPSNAYATSDSTWWVPEADTWYNMTIHMKTDGTLAYYVNGVYQGSFVADYGNAGNNGAIHNNAVANAIKNFTTLKVGASAVNTEGLTGYVRNLSFYSYDGSAATLKTAIDTYERKMASGIIYKNLSDAYAKYQKACAQYDAYIYGEATGVDLDGTAQDLIEAIGKMTYQDYAGTVPVKINDVDMIGSDGVKAYSNVLYSSNSWTLGTNKQNQNMYARSYVLNNVVLYYNGDNTKVCFPTILCCYGNGSDRRTITFAYITSSGTDQNNSSQNQGLTNPNVDTQLELAQPWKGIAKINSNNGTGALTWERLMDGYTVNQNNASLESGVQIGYTYGDTTTGSYVAQRSTSYYCCMGNIVRLKAGNTSLARTGNFLLEYYESDWYSSRYPNGYKFLPNTANIYVVDYYQLTQAIRDNKAEFSGIDVSQYKEGGLTDLFADYDAALNYKPTDDYTTTPADYYNAAQNHCTQYANAVANATHTLAAATTDSNYKALKDAIDYEGQIAAGNTTTVLAAYGTNGNNPADYDAALYATFVTKYEAARTAMAALKNQATYPAASVATTASDLIDAFEALNYAAGEAPTVGGNTLLNATDTISITNNEADADDSKVYYEITYNTGATKTGELVIANGATDSTIAPFSYTEASGASTANVKAWVLVDGKHSVSGEKDFTLFKAPIIVDGKTEVDIDETIELASVNGTNAGTITYAISDVDYPADTNTTYDGAFAPFTGASTATYKYLTVKETKNGTTAIAHYELVRAATFDIQAQYADGSVHDYGSTYYDNDSYIVISGTDSYTGGVTYEVWINGDENDKVTGTYSDKFALTNAMKEANLLKVVAYATDRKTGSTVQTEKVLVKGSNYNPLVYRDGFSDAVVTGNRVMTTGCETGVNLTIEQEQGGTYGTMEAVAHKGQIVDNYNNGSPDSRTNVLKLNAHGNQGTNAKFATNPLADPTKAPAVKLQGATLMFWRYVTDSSGNDIDINYDGDGGYNGGGIGDWIPAISFYNKDHSDYEYFSLFNTGFVSRSDGAVDGDSTKNDYLDIYPNAEDFTNHAASTKKGMWTHFAVTIDPESGVMVYINGDPHPVTYGGGAAGTKYAGGNNAAFAQDILDFITDADTDVSYAFGNAYFNNAGNDLYLDDVRFYAGVYSQADIYNYYNEDRDDVSADLKNSSHDPTGVTAYTLNNNQVVGIEYFEEKYGSNVNPMSTGEVKDVDYYNFGTGMTVYRSKDNYQWAVVGDAQGRCGYQNEDLFSDNYQEALDDQLNYLNPNHKTDYANGTIPQDGAGFLIWAPHVMYNVTLNKWVYYAASSTWGKNKSITFMLTSDYPDHGYTGATTVYKSNSVHPNAIDISTFYGYKADGKLDKDQLYMTIGSWGWAHSSSTLNYPQRYWTYAAIFGDQLNANGTYANAETTDYMELHSVPLARAYMQDVEAPLGATDGGGSGEGSYVIHKYINGTNYYYLFVSYGSNGGSYTERVFRSTEPLGGMTRAELDASGSTEGNYGYKAYNGVSAINGDGDDHRTRGNQLLAPYDINLQDYLFASTGHNSAYTAINSDGEMIDINSVHARPYATADHNWVPIPDGAIIKRQSNLTGNVCLNNVLAFNEEGWPVLLPYQYNGTDSVKRDVDMYTLQGMYTADDMRLAVNSSYSKEYSFTIIAYDETTGLAYGTKPISDTVTIPFSSFVELTEGTDGTNYITMYAGSDNTAPIRYKGVVGSQLVGDPGFEVIKPSIGMMNSYEKSAHNQQVDPDYDISIQSIGEISWAYRSGDVPDSSDVINQADLVSMDHVIYTHASDSEARTIAKAYADEMIDVGEQRYLADGDETYYKWGISKNSTEYNKYLENAVKNSYAVYGQEISDNFQYGSETASGERYTTITVSYPAKLDVNSPDAVYCYSDKERVAAGGYTGSSIEVVSLTKDAMEAAGQGVWYDNNGNQYTDDQAIAASDAIQAELKRYYGLKGRMSDYFKYNTDEGRYTQDGVELIVKYKNIDTGYEFSEFEFCYVMPNPAWAHTMAAGRNNQADFIGNDRQSSSANFVRFVDSYGEATPTYSKALYQASSGDIDESESKYGHGVSNYISDFDGTTFGSNDLATVDKINTLFGFYDTSVGVNSGAFSVAQHADKGPSAYTAVPDVVKANYYVDYSDEQQYKTNNERGLITVNSSGVPTGYEFKMRASNFRWDTTDVAAIHQVTSYAMNNTGLNVSYSCTQGNDMAYDDDPKDNATSAQNLVCFRNGFRTASVIVFGAGVNYKTWYEPEFLFYTDQRTYSDQLFDYSYRKKFLEFFSDGSSYTFTDKGGADKYLDGSSSTGPTIPNYFNYRNPGEAEGQGTGAKAFTSYSNGKNQTHDWKGTATFTGRDRVTQNDYEVKTDGYWYQSSNDNNIGGLYHWTDSKTTAESYTRHGDYDVTAENYANYILEFGAYHKLGGLVKGGCFIPHETYHYYNIGVSTCDKGAVRDFLEKFANKQIKQNEDGTIEIDPDNEGKTDIQVEKVSAASYDDYIRALGKAAWFVYNQKNTLQDDLAGQEQYEEDLVDAQAGEEYVTAYDDNGDAYYTTDKTGNNIFKDNNNTHTDAVQAKLIQDVVDAYYNLYDATNYAKVEDKYLETQNFFENVDTSLYSQESIDDFEAALNAIKPAVSFYVNNEYYMENRTSGRNDDDTYTNPNNTEETYNLIPKIDDDAKEGFWRKSPYDGEQYNQLMEAMEHMKSTLMPRVDMTALTNQLDGNADLGIEGKIPMDEGGIFDVDEDDNIYQRYSYKSWKTIDDALYVDEINYSDGMIAEIYGEPANYTGAIANRSTIVANDLSKYAKKDEQSENITKILAGEEWVADEDDVKFYYYDGDGTDFQDVEASDDFRGYNVDGSALTEDDKHDATSDYSPAQIAVLQRAEDIKNLALSEVDYPDNYTAYNNAYAIVSAVDLNKYIDPSLIQAELAKREPEVYIAVDDIKDDYNARMTAAGNDIQMMEDSGVFGEIKVLGIGETDPYTAALLTAVNTLDSDPATYVKKFKAQLTVSKIDENGNPATGFPQTLTQERYYGETFSFDVPGLTETTTTDPETGVVTTTLDQAVTYSISTKEGQAANFDTANVVGSQKWTYKGTSVSRLADSNVEIAANIVEDKSTTNDLCIKFYNIYGRVVNTTYVSDATKLPTDADSNDRYSEQVVNYNGETFLFRAEDVPFYYFDHYYVEEVKDGEGENANVIGYNYRAKYTAEKTVNYTKPADATLEGGRGDEASVDDQMTLSTEDSDFYAWAVKIPEGESTKYAIASYDNSYSFYAVDDTNFAMVTKVTDGDGYKYQVDGVDLTADMISGTIGDAAGNTGTQNYPYDAEQYLKEKLDQKAPFITVISSSVYKDANNNPITDADGKYMVKSYAIVTSGTSDKINNVTFTTGVTVNNTRKTATANITNINEFGQFTVTVKVKNQAPQACDGQAILNYKFTYTYGNTDYTINAKDTTIRVASPQ